MRGKDFFPKCNSPKKGITPAGAGKSDISHASKCKQSDHPRGCGEKLLIGISGIRNQGSPPRVRGKDRNIIDLFNFKGITPAGAGKSLFLPLVVTPP